MRIYNYLNESESKPNKAGCIPYYYNNDIVYMGFVVPSNPEYGGTKLQISKGRMDGNETSKQTAERELTEEMGIHTNNREPLEFVTKVTITGMTREYRYE